jgi:hypothetical protein
MGKSKKPRRKGLTKEQKAAAAACHAEIGEAIKKHLTTQELNELVASIVRMENKARAEGQRAGVNYAMTITMLVLCDKFGFGKTRLTRLWRHWLDYTEDITAGRLDYAMVAKTLADEYQITIETE